MSRALVPAVMALLLLAPKGVGMPSDLEIPFQKHVLPNGLQVVIHEDHSNPVVAVYVVYHVGSGREEPGRSGFAHLFEHLMFQGSEHVADDEHFKLVQEGGGTLNGTTNRDRTNYFETMPANQLELALWLEADRMGFLLPALTQANLDNQREVVKNERRQNYENRPYAQADGAIRAVLYPDDHGYNWTTIGSHEDLSAASLEDVVNFFQRWYGPNNATLGIGGDVGPQEALSLARKYFGGIPRGPRVRAPGPRAAFLEQDVRLVLEDRVQLPQLSFTWPGAPDGHADSAALELLASVLSANKAALLDKELTIDETLCSMVTAWHGAYEQAGEFTIMLRPVPGVSLDTLEQRVRGILARLAEEGIEPERLERLKARYESNFVNRLETVARRTNALVEANTFRGDPGAATADLEAVLAATPEQVMAALRRYVLDRPAVLMSVVPEGRLDMVARGTSADQVAAEQALDRATRPGPGPEPEFRSPTIWHHTLANGIPVTGTPYDEVPLASITLSLPGGHLREGLEHLGLSSLTAQLMEEGTRDLDAVAFTDALDAIGTTLSVRSSDDELSISVRTLHKHLDRAVGLLTDVVLHPRLDEADFDRLKTQRLTALETRGDSIRTITSNVWRRLVHGDEAPAAWHGAGTLASVEGLTVEDVRGFWERSMVADRARLVVVGDLDAARVEDLFAPLVEALPRGQAAPLALGGRPALEATRVYLVDKPGAPQSEIRIGAPSPLTVNSDDFYPFSIMNFTLGGSFSSRINLNLREDKGYTYGARSSLTADERVGTFTASSGVRTDVTKESVVEFMKELEGIREGITDEETAFAKDSLLQSFTRRYESIQALAGLANAISRNGWPDDYPAQRRATVAGMTRQRMEELASTYIDPAAFAILVVGDAATVREGLAELGYGDVVELDIDGNPVLGM